MILAVLENAVDATSPAPNYAIYALLCTTLITLVGMVINYFKDLKRGKEITETKDNVKAIEVKVDGRLEEFMKTSAELLNVTKGAEYQRGLTAGALIKENAQNALLQPHTAVIIKEIESAAKTGKTIKH